MILTKCIVIGDSGVGKSSISGKYIRNTFNDKNMPTIGIEFYSKIIKINDKQINIQLWDTAGQERFRSVARNYYRDAVGALVCFSIQNINSFENIQIYLKELEMYSKQNIKKILVGTYSDLNDNRTVSKDNAIMFAKKHNMEYIEVSALTGENVHKCFETLFGMIVSGYDDGSIEYKEKESDILNIIDGKKSGYMCC